MVTTERVSRYRFRRLHRADFPLLAGWLAQPHVTRWWNHEHSAAALERDFGRAVDGAEPSEDLVVLRDGEPVGLVQRSRLADYPEYLAEFEAIVGVPAGAVTIDYFVGEQTHTGQGVGTAMLRAIVDDTWRTGSDVPAIIVAVAPANSASWRALERVGFSRVGHGDMTPDNPIDDPAQYVYRLDRPPITPQPT